MGGTITLTCLGTIVWFAYLKAQSGVTTSATDKILYAILAYFRSLKDDSPRNSTTGVNTFLDILEKHPTGCYLCPSLTKQVLSRSLMIKILAAPLANMVFAGISSLLKWM